MNELLAICIPTYNRCDKLADNIKKCIEILAKYKIPIYVSDNASTDNTESMVKELSNSYEYIFYQRNDENMGFGYNVYQVLRMPNTKYRWLLGDDDNILSKSIDELIEQLTKNNFDIVVVNGSQKRGDHIKKIVDDIRIYDDKNMLLSDVGFGSVWMSLMIINKNLIKKGCLHNHPFEHVIETYGYLDNPINAMFFNKPLVICENDGDITWISDTFYLFCKKAVDLNSYLNGYEKKAKDEFLMEFEFSLKYLFKLRALNCLNYKTVYKCREELMLFRAIYRWKVYFTILWPEFFLSMALSIYEKANRCIRKRR